MPAVLTMRAILGCCACFFVGETIVVLLALLVGEL